MQRPLADTVFMYLFTNYPDGYPMAAEWLAREQLENEPGRKSRHKARAIAARLRALERLERDDLVVIHPDRVELVGPDTEYL